MNRLFCGRPSQELVKSIAGLLAQAGISSVLWGDYLLAVYGVPCIISGIDFIIADSDLPAAIAVLQDTNLRPCLCSPETCIVSTDRNPSLPAAFHMHLSSSSPSSAFDGDNDDEDGCGDVGIDVSLRTHLDILWFMPPPALQLFPSATFQPYYQQIHNPTSSSSSSHAPRENYTLASDTTLLPSRGGIHGQQGWGAFSPSGSAVVVPLPHRALEAYLRLACRHWREGVGGTDRSGGSGAAISRVTRYYLDMQTYMAEYVYGHSKDSPASSSPYDGDDPAQHMMSAACRSYWRRFKKGKVDEGILLGDLRRELEEEAGE